MSDRILKTSTRVPPCERMLKYRAMGWSYRAIAKALGISTIEVAYRFGEPKPWTFRPKNAP